MFSFEETKACVEGIVCNQRLPYEATIGIGPA